ncbi:MAG: S9 family peptidase [Flavobacteriaceae bacterium]|nr:S9 family peptidase [Flavobacteriaceae bacterium]
MKKCILLFTFMAFHFSMAQKSSLTPEKLWELGRVSPIKLTQDKQSVLYTVASPDVAANKINSKHYSIQIKTGEVNMVNKDFIDRVKEKISPDGNYKLYTKSVKVNQVKASEFYEDLPESTGRIYTDLQHRHWDKWLDGDFEHLIILNLKTGEEIELLKDKPFSVTHYDWAPDSKSLVYVTKQKVGKEYMTSTDSDIFKYTIASNTTENLTPHMMGYDTYPAYSKNGVLAWLSMAEDGYEADVNDIFILHKNQKINITEKWDNTIFSFLWSDDGQKIYYISPTPGAQHLFVIEPFSKNPKPKQLTEGVFNINSIVGETAEGLILSKNDINHAPEIFVFDFKSNKLRQLTTVNDEFYQNIEKSKVEQRWVKTHDGKEMLVNIFFPPNFDKNKKYPTLLYCQGGPQSPVNQFYSFRWNFALMAAQGYIVVAPNRRGLPGFGKEWNEAISGDWGGKAVQDYLTAIDEVAKEPWVDNERIGAVGASYGGYSVYQLAGIHEGRFKTFISHCGAFNLESMYGTTEEMFFVNKDLGGPYWEQGNPTYSEFNPINFVQNWDTPILIIHNELDYRVPISQGLEAFTAAKMLGVKTKLLYFSDENHWVTKPQNGIMWQRSFFDWLKETL